jgi:hypothetical protein
MVGLPIVTVLIAASSGLRVAIKSWNSYRQIKTDLVTEKELLAQIALSLRPSFVPTRRFELIQQAYEALGDAKPSVTKIYRRQLPFYAALAAGGSVVFGAYFLLFSQFTIWGSDPTNLRGSVLLSRSS